MKTTTTPREQNILNAQRAARKAIDAAAAKPEDWKLAAAAHDALDALQHAKRVTCRCGEVCSARVELETAMSAERVEVELLQAAQKRAEFFAGTRSKAMASRFAAEVANRKTAVEAAAARSAASKVAYAAHTAAI